MELSDIETGSYDSRKFILTIVGTVLITAFSIVAGFIKALPPILPTFIGGVLGVLSLYFGVNVVNKAIVGNIATKQLAITSPTGTTPPTKKPDGKPMSEGGEA